MDFDISFNIKSTRPRDKSKVVPKPNVIRIIDDKLFGRIISSNANFREILF